MANNKDDMPPWLTPVEEIEDSVSGGIFEGNMKKVVVSVAVIVIAVFAVAMWLMYDRPADDFKMPIEVHAETGPIKVKPEDTGGKEILNQDKDVYKRITGDGDEKQPTALASEAEMPLSELPVEKAKQEIKKDVEPTVITKEKKVIKTEEVPKIVPLRDRIVREKPVSVKATPTPVADGKHKLQLGAYGAKEGAAAFWKEIRAKMPSVFKNMHEEYVPLTRNGRTLYRLRVGPVKNRAEADRFCLEVKARQYACMVVDPK